MLISPLVVVFAIELSICLLTLSTVTYSDSYPLLRASNSLAFWSDNPVRSGVSNIPEKLSLSSPILPDSPKVNASPALEPISSSLSSILSFAFSNGSDSPSAMAWTAAASALRPAAKSSDPKLAIFAKTSMIFAAPVTIVPTTYLTNAPAKRSHAMLSASTVPTPASRSFRNTLTSPATPATTEAITAILAANTDPIVDSAASSGFASVNSLPNVSIIDPNKINVGPNATAIAPIVTTSSFVSSSRRLNAATALVAKLISPCAWGSMFWATSIDSSVNWSLRVLIVVANSLNGPLEAVIELPRS